MSFSGSSTDIKESVYIVDEENGLASSRVSTIIGKNSELSDEEKEHLRQYYRKCDLRITLFFCVGYMLDFMVRTSISGAKIVGMIDALKLKPSDFNVALSLFFIGHMLFQIPSNIILKSTRPTLWIMTLLFAMGVCCMSTAAVKGEISLYACRIVLGIVEAGYPAGSLYFLYSWFPRVEVGKRIGYFYSFAAVSNVIEGPLNAGLSKIVDSKIAPWQWVFLILGALPCLWAIVGLFIVSDYPQEAGFLTLEEKRAISKVFKQQGNKSDKKEFNWKQARLAFCDWRIWICCVIGLAAHMVFHAGALFGPVLLKSLGFSSEMSDGLNAIPNVFGFIALASSGFVVNRIGSTGLTQAIYEAVATIGFIVAVVAPHKGSQIAGLFIFIIATAPGMALAAAWVSSNQAGTTKPVIASGLISAGASFGGFITSFIYRDQDAPRYILGHSVCIGLCVLVVILSLLLTWLLSRENRHRDETFFDLSKLSEQEVADLCDRHPSFRYRI
ncbi:hypothetical protein H4219_002129 [Mycoemilia scoparia]|uniref:Major facilitator superfamily (MFS) profile domain-containing protein n=1 Tax=Mycoemilia scoparia TaxID=417184 RepID=A0A9W7ZYD3_9FUNG|nr:hypothetical protein H4219_002129 [Mycoemilia scoparia]